MDRPLLIATDLDGTLLRPDMSIGERTKDILRRVVAAGITVVPVTARQLSGVRAIAADAGLAGPVICGNGALGVDLATSEVLFTQPMPVATLRRVVEVVRDADPDAHFAVIGPRGEFFRAEPAYANLTRHSDHHRAPDTMEFVDLERIVAEDCSKLVLRDAGRTPAELHDLVLGLDLPPCQVTHSGAPFLEVTGAGVTKASGLTLLCERLRVPRERVWAFGDAPNDEAMLAWAGVGHAMANAVPRVAAIADRVIGSNVDEGVADVLADLV